MIDDVSTPAFGVFAVRLRRYAAASFASEEPVTQYEQIETFGPFETTTELGQCKP